MIYFIDNINEVNNLKEILNKNPEIKTIETNDFISDDIEKTITFVSKHKIKHKCGKIEMKYILRY